MMDASDPEAIVGEVAVVTTRILGKDRPGEVQLSFKGGSESFIAYADEVVERGQQVLIIGRRPGRAVEVIYFAG
jgi:hypothetical protein